MYAESILELIGNTPLLSLKPCTQRNLFAKAEFLNPGGSIKDRIAKHMLEEAQRCGTLKPGMTIVEPTSGNTGIGLALCGIRMGYAVTIVMPENMSEERKHLIRALGAELILTPKELSVDGAVSKALELAALPGYFLPQQFQNPANPGIHYATTGPELFRQLDGKVDVFVAGVGSGGTLQGVATYLREQNPNVKIVAVEPKNVSALLGHGPGPHEIQGIGDGFIPDVLDPTLVDLVVEVTDEDAIRTARELARVQGILCGISSGANVWAALEAAKRYGDDAIITTVLPDRAERYFSTPLFQG